jgi:hypothetical protein
MTITLSIVSPLPRDFETPSVGFIFGLRETSIMRERERERERERGGMREMVLPIKTNPDGPPNSPSNVLAYSIKLFI